MTQIIPFILEPGYGVCHRIEISYVYDKRSLVHVCCMDP